MAEEHRSAVPHDRNRSLWGRLDRSERHTNRPQHHGAGDRLEGPAGPGEIPAGVAPEVRGGRVDRLSRTPVVDISVTRYAPAARARGVT